MLPSTVSRDVYNAIKERGAPVVLRRVSLGSGPAPLPSPPVVEDMVVDGAVLVGAAAISLRGTACRGILQPHDVITIAGVNYGVVSQVASRSVTAPVPGFDAINVTPAVTVPIVDGAPVDFSYAADSKTYAMIAGFPRRLIDGSLILASDLSVMVSAFGIQEPLPLSRIIIAGKERTVVTVQPTYQGDTPVTWRLQAR